MSIRHYPILYEVRTRVLLSKISTTLGKKATLDDIPDKMMDQWADRGFEWIWMLGVWQTGQAGKKISISHSDWRQEFMDVLPDLKDKDISGSCFSIKDYKVHSDFGGEKALADFRKRLKRRGMKLMLDFVPNHTSHDHRWVKLHPDYYISGKEEDLKNQPGNYTRVDISNGKKIMAYGRDPNFPGWPDTLQLDYSNPHLQNVVKEELIGIASKCDGIRCDMAMLLLPDVFEMTWRRMIRPFWPGAIERVRDKYPDFMFLAEVYWDREWEMQQLGFDYCYDKRLYDRLLHPYAPSIKDHLRAGLSFQNRLARFLENHDEPRAVTLFHGDMHRAAAVITYLTPGMKFFHEGQLKGFQQKIPVHLNRGPDEAVNREIAEMYNWLLQLLQDDAFRKGEWQHLDCRQAWESDDTFHDILAFWWKGPGHSRNLIAVNYSPGPSKCYVALPFPELAGRNWRLADRSSAMVYDREGNLLIAEGLYVDMPAWETYILKVEENTEPHA